MALARVVLCSGPPCSPCQSGAAGWPRGGFSFLVSAGPPLCAGDGGDSRVLRGELDAGPWPAGCRGLVVRGRLKLSDAPVVENGQVWSSVEIPVTCYQIIGVSEKAEKDQVVKTVMELKASDIEDGYTMDVILSRQDLLMDLRDKLLFEPEFAGDVKEKVPPKASLQIPWTWLPAALCLLQEVGEDKLVLDIGRSALQHQDAKSYAHDLLLSMALAECSIAKTAFEKSKVSKGFEALARAQYFLRSKPSLEKLSLLSQIEESLEGLAPACTLELLSMPPTLENGERRRKAIAALQELLRQGLEVETSCRVQDWSCFLSHALNKLMAAEIVELLSWDTLAATRKNKKSLESQNQRIVIDLNCFYVAMIAHVALGFSTRQKEVIDKAKTLCECLSASEGVNLKFEESFCSLLLGQGLDKTAIEKLHQLQANGSTMLSNAEFASSNKDPNGKIDANQSLEMWLKDSVLGVFSDTRDCSPSLANYFGGQKRLLIGVNHQKGMSRTIPDVGRKPSSGLSLQCKSVEDAHTHGFSTRHLGEAVKQLAPLNVGNQLTADKINGNTSKPSMPLKTNKQGKVILQSWWAMVNGSGSFAYAAMLGCLVACAVKFGSIKFGHMVCPSKPTAMSSRGQASTSSRIKNSHTDSIIHPASADHNSKTLRLVKQLKIWKKHLVHPDEAGSLKSACSDFHLDLSAASVAAEDTTRKRKMPLEDAESLLRKWQTIKAEALGPSHQIEMLSDILSETMLSQWTTLANSAKRKSCFWRFVLLRLSVQRADILPDGDGGEMAEIEAVLEEAAELVDGTQHKNPNYYSTYKILYTLKREYDGPWRFCEGDIQESP